MVRSEDISDQIFRGYDIRGVVDKDLNPQVMEFLGKGYGTFLCQRRINEAVVGRDNRLTSLDYKNSFIKGLRSTGVKVIDFDLGLSQIMYFAQYYFRCKGGAFVTASHNPKDFNGLKLATGFSQTMISEEIQELKKITQKGKYSQSDRLGGLEKVNIFPAYLDDLLKKIKIERKFKVVVEGCNGAGGYFMPTILKKFGCLVVEQNTSLDGNFPQGTPDPTEKKVQERLADRVVREKADLGFSYDADGDRMGVVDEKGNLIWNDSLVAIFAKDVLDFLPKSKIIFNTLCSKQVPDTIEAEDGLPIMWLTGHSFIKAKVAEERAAFGGELSGHFFFLDNFYGHDDGAYSSLRLLDYLARTDQSLSRAISSLPRYISSPEIKLGCPDLIKFDLISKKIYQDLRKMSPSAKFTLIDGVRFDTKNEMVIIRASQNGPYITIKFEAKTDQNYETIREKLSKILHSYKEIDFTKGVNSDVLK